MSHKYVIYEDLPEVTEEDVIVAMEMASVLFKTGLYSSAIYECLVMFLASVPGHTTNTFLREMYKLTYGNLTDEHLEIMKENTESGHDTVKARVMEARKLNEDVTIKTIINQINN